MKEVYKMKIEHLVETLGNAIQESHRNVELNSVNNFFNNYFEQVESNNFEQDMYKPKLIKIIFPTDDNNQNKEKIIVTPVASLVQHNNMNIDYVKLNLNINVLDEDEDGLDVSSQNLKDNSNAKENTDKSGEMEIMFKCSGTPEGISRIETHLNSLI